MGRTTAIAVLLFLLLPLCLPLAPTKAESSLPACCRQDGKHRCSVATRFRLSAQGQPARPTARSANEPCPYRSMLFAPAAPDAIGIPVRAVFCKRAVAYSKAILQAVRRSPTPEAHNHPKRGPPPLFA